jgi:tetratricopeptide (TPR) repeat protein
MRTLARAHLQNNEASLAEEVLRGAIKASPRDAASKLDLASLLAQSGRPDPAQQLLLELVAVEPANLDARTALFRVQLGRQDLVGARRTAEDIKKLRPDLGNGYFFAGQVDELEKKPAAAREEYEHALQEDPDAVEPLTALVRFDLAERQVPAALKRLDASIARNAGHVIALNLKGEVLAGAGRFDEAALSFNDAIKRAPKWWIPYRGLALTQMSAKQTDAAIATLRQGNAATNGAPALFTDLAALYQRLERPEDAIKTYDELASRNPKLQFAANNLAMLLVTYHKDQRSLDRAQQLAESLAGSTEGPYLNTRGWVKFKLGQVKEALPLLQAAVEKVPASAEMRYHLGMALLASGDRVNAAKNLEIAVSSGARFNGIDEARQALENARARS